MIVRWAKRQHGLLVPAGDDGSAGILLAVVPQKVAPIALSPLSPRYSSSDGSAKPTTRDAGVGRQAAAVCAALCRECDCGQRRGGAISGAWQGLHRACTAP